MRFVKHHFILILVALLTILFIPIITTALTPEQEWVRYEKNPDGFAISLPPGWVEFNMDKNFLNRTLETIKQNHPNGENLAKMVKQMAQAGYFKFFAYDSRTISSGFSTNINIIKQLQNPQVSLADYTELSKAQLESMENIIKPINNRIINTFSGDGMFLEYKSIISERHLDYTQLLFVKGSDIYIVTLTTNEEQAKNYKLIFEKICQSFQTL